jgi:FAD/FMN-containing dehydrogenase
VAIAEDGKSATVGGGILTKRLMDQLWENGKTSITGACECTGAIAPLLGGGHGWLQGRYGLAADQLISARWVLGNGTIIDVSSTSHPDLFWVIRGAGHNFGIATEVEYRVYDRSVETDGWTMQTVIYDEGRLEEVFGAANEMMERYEDVVELGHWIEIITLPGFGVKVSGLEVTLVAY